MRATRRPDGALMAARPVCSGLWAAPTLVSRCPDGIPTSQCSSTTTDSLGSQASWSSEMGCALSSDTPRLMGGRAHAPEVLRGLV